MTIAKEGICDVCNEELQSVSIQVFGVLEHVFFDVRVAQKTKQSFPWQCLSDFVQYVISHLNFLFLRVFS